MFLDSVSDLLPTDPVLGSEVFLIEHRQSDGFHPEQHPISFSLRLGIASARILGQVERNLMLLDSDTISHCPSI
jgi:hypothetical protein